MRKTLIAIAFSLVAGAAAAQTPGPVRPKLDLDGDRRISLSEMRTAALARFDRIDVDRDGRLTAQERQAAKAQRHAARAARHAERGRQHRERAVAAGRDPNRVVARVELDARVQQRFARLDGNRDGFVSREERRAARDMRRQAG